MFAERAALPKNYDSRNVNTLKRNESLKRGHTAETRCSKAQSAIRCFLIACHFVRVTCSDSSFCSRLQDQRAANRLLEG